MRGLTRWAFVIPILWIGFVLAISFMETPLKFRAASVTVPIGVEIGQLVFHALNRIEVLFALLVAFCVVGERRPSDTTLSVLSVNVVIFAQTILLFGPLDARARAVIAGISVPAAPWHVMYIGLEVAKVILLVGLASRLVRDFRALDRPLAIVPAHSLTVSRATELSSHRTRRRR